MKEKPLDLDNKDQGILRCIREKPETNLKEIHHDLQKIGEVSEEVPYSTVQKRLDRLKKEGAIKEIFSVNLQKTGFQFRYRIDILIDPEGLKQGEEEGLNSQKAVSKYIVETLAKDKKYKDEIIVDDVFILLGGQYDMSLHIRARDLDVVSEFVTESLRKTSGIRNTMTIQLIDSYKNGWS